MIFLSGLIRSFFKRHTCDSLLGGILVRPMVKAGSLTLQVRGVLSECAETFASERGTFRL